MFKLAKPFFLHVITPLHAGSGEGLGVVDLPIQRERHTGFPKIEGSSLKGSMREVFEEKYDRKDDRIDLHLTFGYDESNETKDEVKKYFKDNDHTEFAGALGFTDARILFFPVKSMKGVFAWITCPKVLQRFTKDLSVCQPAIKNEKLLFSPTDVKKAYCSSDKIKLTGKDKIVLEEYTFDTEKENAGESEEKNPNFVSFVAELVKCIGIDELQDKAVMLPNDDFDAFVQHSTEVITRTKIDNEKGTVAKGQLFTEEYLPAETILYSLALSSPLFVRETPKQGRFSKSTDADKVMNFFKEGLNEYMQIGANATLGKGIVATKIFSPPKQGKETKKNEEQNDAEGKNE